MNKSAYFFFFSALILLFGSCDGIADRQEGLLNLVLVDAPPAYDSVFVEILGVDVSMNVQGRESTQEVFFIPYELGNKQVKVSDLVGGEVLLLGRSPLPVGQITQLAVRLGTRNFLWERENRYALNYADGVSEEVVLPLSLNIETGFSYDVILDFDLEKSIQTISTNPLRLNFTPSIDLVIPGNVGEIRGTFSQNQLRPAIFAIANGDSTSTHANSSGTYLFRLPEGTYTLYFDPKNQNFLPDTLLNVEVEAGETLTLDRLTFRVRP